MSGALILTDQGREEEVLELDVNQRAGDVDKPVGQQRSDTQEEQVVEQIALVLGDLYA